MSRRQNGPFKRTQGSSVEIAPPDGVAGWRLVEDEAAFSELVEELSSEPAYAIDTEFHRERTYYPHLALVQIGWAGGIALVDPLAVDVRPLAGLFELGALGVLHAADQDLEVLERACGRTPTRIFDTQASAGFLGFSSPSLLTLTEAVLGHRLHKADQLADWVHRPLSHAQQAYAAGDVAYLLQLHDVVSERLETLGRTEWAAEECAILLRKDRSATVPEEAWWRLPHSRQLRGASRAVAQEVAAWRERRAQRQDLPVRFVLSDLALLSVAQRPPTQRGELQRIRGVDQRHLGGGAGDELFAAIEAGKALPASRLRLPSEPPMERPNRPVIALASAYVQQRASDLELDPAVLATRADLAAFFQHKRAGRLTSGWRYDLIGAELERLAAGSASLAFDGRGALVLERRTGEAVG
jgi:ribonuclease D